MGEDFPLPVDLHQAGQGQAVLPRVQGAEAVGQAVRQHGNHAVHQVHAGAAAQGLPVQGTPLLHVMAHVGDVNPQSVADSVRPLLLLKAHGVVQILGVLPVDGHHLHIPQIQASGLVPLRNLIGDLLLHLGHHLRRELLRQLIGPDDGEDVHPGVVDMAQDLHDLPLRVLGPVSVIGDPRHHLVAGHRPHIFPLGDEQVTADLLVVGNHKAKVLILLVIAHDLPVGPLQHPDHRAL